MLLYTCHTGLLPKASAKAPASHGDNSVWKRKSLDPGAEVYMTDDASSSSASPFRPAGSDATGASESGADDGAISDRRKHFSVFILFLINLLNYMDRFTVAGLSHSTFTSSSPFQFFFA